MRKIFQYQIWHLLSLTALVTLLALLPFYDLVSLKGSLWGLNSVTWFWIAVAIPIIHQIYVWFVWRLELYRGTFTSLLGLKTAFRIYTVGFFALFVGRLISITILAWSTQNSLVISAAISYSIAVVITPMVLYLFYSVKHYFTFSRALGIDHFEKGYKQPFEKRGIFRFTNNAMYIIGLMILYLPGLLLFSKEALIVALFNHLYIWVHYYCTEQPDMQVIYGNTPDE